MKAGLVSIAITVHDSDAERATVDWIRNVDNDMFGNVPVSLQTHPYNASDCEICRRSKVETTPKKGDHSLTQSLSDFVDALMRAV